MSLSRIAAALRSYFQLIIIFLIVSIMDICVWDDVLASETLNVGRVYYVEGNEIVIKNDHSSGTKIIKNQRLEIFNYDGDRVATVSVRNVNDATSEIKCKTMRGAGKIEPGYQARMRKEVRWALILGSSMLPVNAEANTQYTDITGESSDRTGELGYSFEIGGIFRTGPDFWRSINIPLNIPLQFQITTGYVNFGMYQAWKVIDIGPIWRYEIYPERFHLEFGGSWSISAPLEEMKWARLEGTYSDKIKVNQGNAKVASIMTYGGWIGLNYQFTREFTCYARSAYYMYSSGNVIYSDAPEDDTGQYEGYQIVDEWLESNMKSDGGFVIVAGIQLWIK